MNQYEGRKTIPAQMQHEAAGFDAEQARALAALMNVRDDKGDVSDHVQLFQRPAFASSEERQLAEAEGYIGSRLGQWTFAISRQGVPTLIAAHRSGEIPGLTDDPATSGEEHGPD